jgi:hypothetical protein
MCVDSFQQLLKTVRRLGLVFLYSICESSAYIVNGSDVTFRTIKRNVIKDFQCAQRFSLCRLLFFCFFGNNSNLWKYLQVKTYTLCPCIYIYLPVVFPSGECIKIHFVSVFRFLTVKCALTQIKRMCHVRKSLVSQSVQQYVDLEANACLLLRCDAASLGKWFETSFETLGILYPVSQRHIAE